MGLTVRAMDSSTLSTLFSGLPSGGAGTSTLLADYYSIRNGSYLKLMKSYYGMMNEEVSSSSKSDTKTKEKTKTETAKTEVSDTKLNKVKAEATDLQTAAGKLLDKGTDSVFAKKTVTAEDGTKTSSYDMDGIYKAVKGFVDSYNDMISAGGDTGVSGIDSSVKGMISSTKANERLLGKIGITVLSDNSLAIDEETFKKADVNAVKSLFNTSGAYGYQVSSKASMVNYHVSNQVSKGAYNSKGSYSTSNYQNSSYSSYF